MMPHFREKWERLWPRLGIIAIAAFAIISTTVVTLQIREEIRQTAFRCMPRSLGSVGLKTRKKSSRSRLMRGLRQRRKCLMKNFPLVK